MSYDNVEYWSKRKNPNSDDIYIDTPMHMDFLKKHLHGVDSILDCGAGTGRLLEAYSEASIVEAYDIVETYKERLLERSRQLGINLSFTLGQEIKFLPYKDKQFDVAIATEVLLHLKYDDVVIRMSELARVAKKVIIISWMEAKGIDHGHCFHHNYIEICEKYNYKILYLERYKRQIMFVYKES